VTGSGRARQVVDVEARLGERASKPLVHDDEYRRFRDVSKCPNVS
jgi:hypothetical protein